MVDAPTLAEPPAEGTVSTTPVSVISPESPEKPPEAALLVKPAPAKTTAKPILSRRPRSLDELITQISAGR
jgi:hypothetical protein